MHFYRRLERDALRRIKLGAELRELLVRLGVALEEGLLVRRKLLRKRLEAVVGEQRLVRRELEQFGIRRLRARHHTLRGQ